MKQYILSLTVIALSIGCMTPQSSINPQRETVSSPEVPDCNYDGMQTPVFKLDDLARNSASNYIRRSVSRGFYHGYMGDAAKFLPIVDEGFRFTGRTNIDPDSRFVTWEDHTSLDGIPVRLRYGSSGSHSEVVGADCRTYWFETNSQSLTAFGDGLTLEQMNHVFGSTNVQVIDFEDEPAQIDRDKFKKMIVIRGTRFDNSFFRMWGDYDTNSLGDTAQLYTVHTARDWLFLNRAHDEDGNNRKATEISRGE